VITKAELSEFRAYLNSRLEKDVSRAAVYYARDFGRWFKQAESSTRGDAGEDYAYTFKSWEVGNIMVLPERWKRFSDEVRAYPLFQRHYLKVWKAVPGYILRTLKAGGKK